jgi:hypothetical protein
MHFVERINSHDYTFVSKLVVKMVYAEIWCFILKRGFNWRLYINLKAIIIYITRCALCVMLAGADNRNTRITQKALLRRGHSVL